MSQVGGAKSNGKRILMPGSSANTYSNVIGGSYQVGDGVPMKPQVQKVPMLQYPPVPPIQHHNIDMYYAPIQAREGGY